MTAQNNAARVAVQAEPCQKFAPLVTTPVGKTWEGAPNTNREARRLVNEVRAWANQFDAPDAKALAASMDDMERLFVRVWTEISESLLCLSLADSPHGTPERAAEMRANAVSYLRRWNTGEELAP